MKRILLLLAITLATLTLSAQSTYKYSFGIKDLSHEQLKVAGQIGSSIFLSAVQFENDDYQTLVFRTSAVVREEDVKKLYGKNGFQIIDFKSEEERTQ